MHTSAVGRSRPAAAAVNAETDGEQKSKQEHASLRLIIAIERWCC